MKNQTAVIKLLTPSWLVNFVGLSIGIVVTGAVILLTRYQSSSLRFQVFDVQSRSVTANHHSVYQNLTSHFANNHLVDSLPLLFTWACVGLVVYFFAISIARSFGKAASLYSQMDYVNASKSAMLRQALISLAIRITAVIGWFGFIKLSLAFIVPYALASASAAATRFSLPTASYALLAIIVLYAAVVLHAIFLRLMLLKPRVFGS